jgi:hypothetical protein
VAGHVHAPRHDGDRTALTGCGSSPGTSAAPTTTTTVAYGRGDLRSIYCTGEGSTKACGGLVPAAGGVTDRILLGRTTVTTGTTIRGSVEVVNNTGHVINLVDFHGCQPSMGVAMTNATIAPGIGFAAVCVARPIALASGITRMPISVTTS